MPIYYKKVKRNSSDAIYFGESGNRFASGIRSKLNIINARSKNGADGLELKGLPKDTSASPLIQTDTNDNQQSSSGHLNEDNYQRLITKYGPIVVVKQGIENRNGKSVIITYHDIGLNYSSNFESFFSISENKLLLQTFSVYHVNAPGQEEDADDLPNNYTFPTMDQLAEQILVVCEYNKINSFIGFGFGAGANVLSRFALAHPDSVEGLFLINPSATTSTWSEWFYQKRNIRQLSNPYTNLLPPIIQDYMLWHLFGNLNLPDRIVDNEAADIYRRYFNGRSINVHNLAPFIESYINRSGLGICRSDLIGNFRCNVLVLCGNYSPHVEESIKMNSRLDPTNSTWIKLSDCGMVLEEQPQRVSEALVLFLQGLGYTLKAYNRKRALMSGMSMPCLANSTIDIASRHMSSFEIDI